MSESKINYFSLSDLSKNETKTEATKNTDPFDYFKDRYGSSGGPLGIFTGVKTDKDGNAIPDPYGTNKKEFKNTYNMLNPRSFDNEMEDEQHSKDMYMLSITNPVKFLQVKQALLKKFQITAKDFRDSIFDVLLSSGIRPIRAEETASSIAKSIWTTLKSYLDKEILPSQLEHGVLARQSMMAEKRINASKQVEAAMTKDIGKSMKEAEGK